MEGDGLQILTNEVQQSLVAFLSGCGGVLHCCMLLLLLALLVAGKACSQYLRSIRKMKLVLDAVSPRKGVEPGNLSGPCPPLRKSERRCPVCRISELKARAWTDPQATGLGLSLSATNCSCSTLELPPSTCSGVLWFASSAALQVGLG